MSRLTEMLKRLEEIGKSEEDFPRQNVEHRRQVIVESAVRAADELIMEGSDGSVEETDFLTAAVMKVFSQKVYQAIVSRLLRADLFPRVGDPADDPRGKVIKEMVALLTEANDYPAIIGDWRERCTNVLKTVETLLSPEKNPTSAGDS